MITSNPSPSFESPTSLESGNQTFATLPNDSEIWESLKQAIAVSSGFQRWQLEQGNNEPQTSVSLDLQIRHYLRETLETLAY